MHNIVSKIKKRYTGVYQHINTSPDRKKNIVKVGDSADGTAAIEADTNVLFICG